MVGAYRRSPSWKFRPIWAGIKAPSVGFRKIFFFLFAYLVPAFFYQSGLNPLIPENLIIAEYGDTSPASNSHWRLGQILRAHPWRSRRMATASTRRQSVAGRWEPTHPKRTTPHMRAHLAVGESISLARFAVLSPPSLPRLPPKCQGVGSSSSAASRDRAKNNSGRATKQTRSLYSETNRTTKPLPYGFAPSLVRMGPPFEYPVSPPYHPPPPGS